MVEPGLMLAHYKLVEKIGEGGMGVVWKALDTTLNREAAIKILPEAFAHMPDGESFIFGAPDDSAAEIPITLILNWQSEAN